MNQDDVTYIVESDASIRAIRNALEVLHLAPKKPLIIKHLGGGFNFYWYDMTIRLSISSDGNMYLIDSGVEETLEMYDQPKAAVEAVQYASSRRP